MSFVNNLEDGHFMRQLNLLTCLFLSLGISLTALASENVCLNNLNANNSSSLNVMNCDLNDADVPTLVAFLNKNPGILSLYAVNNHIGDAGAKALRQCKSIAGLILDNNQVSDVGAEDLAKMNLYKLSLNNNKITDQGAIALANSTTRVLMLNHNQITDVGAGALGETTHEELELNDNKITDRGVLQFEKNASYMAISLAGNHLTDQSAKSLATLPNLLSLNLERNQITNAGAIAILKGKGRISNLQLGKNLLNDDVVNLFVDKYFSFLSLGGYLTDKSVPLLLKTRAEKTDLSDNLFTDKGAMKLVNIPTEDLSLAGNSISDNTAVYFAAQRKRFRLLDFSRTGLGDQGAIALGTSHLYQNLLFAHDQLTDIAAKAIAQKSGSMYLDISYNHISPTGISALKSNPYIHLTAMEGNDG